MSEDIKRRANEIRQTLEATRHAWPFFSPVLIEMRAAMVERLIASEDPEARGQIKAIQSVLDLPETLQGELVQIEQALSDLPDSAD